MFAPYDWTVRAILATVGTLSFLLTFLFTKTGGAATGLAFTRIGFFYIKGKLLTRLEKFYLKSSLPMRDISEVINYLSAALKGLLR